MSCPTFKIAVDKISGKKVTIFLRHVTVIDPDELSKTAKVRMACGAVFRVSQGEADTIILYARGLT